MGISPWLQKNILPQLLTAQKVSFILDGIAGEIRASIQQQSAAMFLLLLCPFVLYGVGACCGDTRPLETRAGLLSHRHIT